MVRQHLSSFVPMTHKHRIGSGRKYAQIDYNTQKTPRALAATATAHFRLLAHYVRYLDMRFGWPELHSPFRFANCPFTLYNSHPVVWAYVDLLFTVPFPSTFGFTTPAFYQGRFAIIHIHFGRRLLILPPLTPLDHARTTTLGFTIANLPSLLDKLIGPLLYHQSFTTSFRFTMCKFLPPVIYHVLPPSSFCLYYARIFTTGDLPQFTTILLLIPLSAFFYHRRFTMFYHSPPFEFTTREISLPAIYHVLPLSSFRVHYV